MNLESLIQHIAEAAAKAEIKIVEEKAFAACAARAAAIPAELNPKIYAQPNIYALGSLSHSQALREGYPGAIYYYLARPHRVYEFNFRAGEINVRREAYYTTKPLAQNMVFPKLPHGGIKLWKSAHGFLMEAELQVSERVAGFVETRGGTKQQHLYQPGSEYSEKPLMRMFETTGVCWFLPSSQLITEAVALQILEAFCLKYGIQSRDIGIGTFHCNNSPLSNGAATAGTTAPCCRSNTSRRKPRRWHEAGRTPAGSDGAQG